MAFDAARAWLGEAAEFVEWDGPPRINRLDVVRDFETGAGALGPAEVIASMGAVPVTLAATKAHYRDATAHQAQTFMVRTKRSGGGRLYDKGRESNIEEAAGIVRFEAEERKAGLRKGGVLFLSDLKSADLVSIGRCRFEWCGFHREFSPAEALIARVWADPDMTEGAKLQLTGFYSLRSLGVGLALERSRDYRLRKLAERFGYPSEASWRLDWEEGLVAA